MATRSEGKGELITCSIVKPLPQASEFVSNKNKINAKESLSGRSIFTMIPPIETAVAVLPLMRSLISRVSSSVKLAGVPVVS